MFDERRHRTVGIDKSYPLQPISTTTTRKSPVPPTTTRSTTNRSSTMTTSKSFIGYSSSNNSISDKKSTRLPASADAHFVNVHPLYLKSLFIKKYILFQNRTVKPLQICEQIMETIYYRIS